MHSFLVTAMAIPSVLVPSCGPVSWDGLEGTVDLENDMSDGENQYPMLPYLAPHTACEVNMISGLCDAIFTTTTQGTGIDIAVDFEYPHCSHSTLECVAINRTSTNGFGPLIVVGATTLGTPAVAGPMMKPQARSVILPIMDGVGTVSIVIALCLALLLRMFFSAHVEWARSFSPAALHDIGMHPNRTLKNSWHAWMRAHPPSKTKQATITELMGDRHPGVDEEEVEQAEAMPEPQQNLGAMSRTSPARNSAVSDSHTNKDAATQIKSELEDLVVARQRILELEDLLTAPDQISQYEATTILEKRNRDLQHELWASEQALADLETDFEQLEYRFYISIAKENKLDENKSLKQQLETTTNEVSRLQKHEELVAHENTTSQELRGILRDGEATRMAVLERKDE